MRTTKKISLVILAGLFAGLASFGAYSLVSYLSQDKLVANDGDARLSLEPEAATSPTEISRPEEVVAKAIAAAKENTPEEISFVTNDGVEPVSKSELANPTEVETVKVTEKRDLVYRGPEGGDSFSELRGLEEADLVAGFTRLVAKREGANTEENRDNGNANDSNSSTPGGEDPDPGVEPVDPDPEVTPGRVNIARVGVQVAGGTAKIGGGAALDSGDENGSQANLNLTSEANPAEMEALASPPAQETALTPAPAQPSALRSRVGSNGRVFVGGGWYSNAASGNIGGVAGGQNPSTPQRVTVDATTVNGISLNGNSQLSGLPNGISPRLPAGSNSGLGGFQPGIPNTPNSIQPRSIVPSGAGGGTPSGFTLPVVPSGNIPAAGGGGRINIGGIKLP